MKSNLHKLLVPAFSLFLTFNSGAQVISTVVGNGSGSYSGDGTHALSASIYYPRQVDVDAYGNLYIADYKNNVIRKVTASTNIISTVAGNGTAGYAGDGQSAISAELNTPSWVSVDAAGNLYIADIGNYVVRKVNTSGIITTIAGNGTAGYIGDKGKAVNAELYWPYAVIPDNSGNLYISDFNNMSIRKVTNTGIITTIAGTGAAGYSGDGGQGYLAKLSGLAGIALDASNNLYIADYYNFVVRKLTPGGIISTVAGNNTYGDGGDGIATAESMSGPISVALDFNGNLYISDAGASRIRFVNSSGFMSTYAGNGTAGYSGDGGHGYSAEVNGCSGSKIDRYGNFFFADQANNVIRVVSAANVAVNGVKTINKSPFDLVLGPNPNKGNFTLTGTLYSLNDENVSLEVTNMLGQMVYNNTLLASKGNINAQITLENNLPSGIYQLHIVSETQTDMIRFVVEK